MDTPGWAKGLVALLSIIVIAVFAMHGAHQLAPTWGGPLLLASPGGLIWANKGP